MNAFLLAAGRGTRLKELTATTAKPALPVAGLPMLAYSLNFFFQAHEYLSRRGKPGIAKLVVNTHHCPETISQIFAQGEWPWRLHLSHEIDLLETGGGVKKCEAMLSDDTVFLANGDVVCDADATKLLEFHRAQRAALTLVVVPHARAQMIAPVSIDSDGNVKDINRTFDPHSHGDHLYAGIALFEPQLFAYLRTEPSSIVYTGYTGLIAAGKKVCAYVHEGLWYDCGTPESYAQVNAEVTVHQDHWQKRLHPAVRRLAAGLRYQQGHSHPGA